MIRRSLEDWTSTILGKIVSLRKERCSPADMRDAPFLGLEDVESHTSRVLKFGRSGDMKSVGGRFFKGDILYSRLRPYLNKAIVAEIDGLASAEFLVLKPSPGVLPDFVLHRIMMNDFLEFTASLDRGDRPRVDFPQISAFPIILPPLADQARIVTRIGQIKSQVGNVREQVRGIIALADRYKRAILAAASSGRLTSQWRGNSERGEDAASFLARLTQDRLKDRRKSQKGVSIEGAMWDAGKFNSDCPVGWSFARVRDVVECLDYKRVPINRGDRLCRTGDVPYYGANGPVGTIDAFIFDEDLVLVVEDETFVGRQKPFSYVIRGKSWVNNHAHVLRPLGEFPVELLNAILSYYDFIPLTSGTTGRRKLTQASLLDAPILIPPPAEQHQIVLCIAEAMSKIEIMLRESMRANELLERFTQANFAEAFRGKLT